MPGRALCGTDVRLVCVFAEGQFESYCLGDIVERSSCAVCIDVEQIIRCVSGLIEGRPDGCRLRETVRSWSSHVMCVAGVSIAGNFSKDLSAACFRVLILFEDEHRCALGHHEATSVLVERE